MKVYDVENLKVVLNDVEITDWYTDMEKYIRDYKHLIGCSFKHLNQKGCYIKKVDLGIWNIDKFYISVLDNANYIYQLKNIKLYLSEEDSPPVDYETYMKYHYPEYVHVWSQQL